MTKRVGLFLTLGLLVFGILAVAETPVPETPGAVVGGNLIIASSQTFKDMDPRIANSAYDSYVIGVVFDGLIILHPETLAVPVDREVLGHSQRRAGPVLPQRGYHVPQR
jgi:ABC-type oligopeptide transport system substrate-binding subunit